MKWSLLCFFLLFFHEASLSQKRIQLSSPDNRISFSFGLVHAIPTYSVSFKGTAIIESSDISLSFNHRDFEVGDITKASYRRGIEEYELVVGKTKKVKDPYREVTIPLKDRTGSAQLILVVRICDGGIGLRFDFLSGYGKDSLVLTEERVNFKFPTGTVARTLLLPNYTSSHEGFYTTMAIDQLKEKALMDLPTLFELPNHTYCALTEAALVDYAGMYLTKENGVLRTTLSPWPGQTSIKVKSKFPHQSPWRVLLISDRIGELMESNIITNLNEPNAIQDVSWIKPGKTTFPWWNGNVLPDTLNAPGNNFVTQQYYIDFCARNGIEYHSVVEYGLHQWYMDDGVGFQPGPHSDVTTPVPGLDMKEICDYAKHLGVGIRVWVHFYALNPKLD